MDFFPRRNFDFGFDLFRDPFGKENNIMKTDISEKEDSYLLEMDLPGMNKEDIIIDYHDGYLEVSAKKENRVDEEKEYIRHERIYGEYRRSFYVGSIDESSIKAKYNNGILIVEVPKQQVDASKKSIIID